MGDEDNAGVKGHCTCEGWKGEALSSKGYVGKVATNRTAIVSVLWDYSAAENVGESEDIAERRSGFLLLSA